MLKLPGLGQKNNFRKTHHYLGVHAVSDSAVPQHEHFFDDGSLVVSATTEASPALVIPLQAMPCIIILLALPWSLVTESRNEIIPHRGGVSFLCFLRRSILRHRGGASEINLDN